MDNKEGQKIPSVTFRTRTREGEWKDVTTDDLFKGKRVVVFSLPGAFTPTCSTAHVPRYNELKQTFRAQGIDDILCVSVNDAFVMNAWQDDQQAPEITFVPDGNGDFTKGMGMLVDKREIGFGPRSWRYAMIVKDGVIEKMFIEPEQPGDPYEVSDADTVLSFLTGGKEQPHDILLMTRPHCSHCTRAKAALTEKGLKYHEVPSATPGMLKAASGRVTTPQVFIDGKHIGGADELVAYLKG